VPETKTALVKLVPSIGLVEYRSSNAVAGSVDVSSCRAVHSNTTELPLIELRATRRSVIAEGGVVSVGLFGSGTSTDIGPLVLTTEQLLASSQAFIAK
jgi:hypothetical protein